MKENKTVKYLLIALIILLIILNPITSAIIFGVGLGLIAAVIESSFPVIVVILLVIIVMKLFKD